MKLKKSDVMMGHWEFNLSVQVQMNTEQYKFLFDRYLSTDRIEGLVEDFGYSGAVVVVGHEMMADGNGLSGLFELKSVT